MDSRPDNLYAYLIFLIFHSCSFFPYLPESLTAWIAYNEYEFHHYIKPCLHLIRFNAHLKPVSKLIRVDAHQCTLMRFGASTLMIGTQRKKPIRSNLHVTATWSSVNVNGVRSSYPVCDGVIPMAAKASSILSSWNSMQKKSRKQNISPWKNSNGSIRKCPHFVKKTSERWTDIHLVKVVSTVLG